MARKDDFHEHAMNCVMCPKKIPPERPKLAVTCSKECTIARKNYWRSKQDMRVCRYCYKPSTPEQRAAYQQWRRRPQNAEEEEQFRLWREAQARRDAADTRIARRVKETEEAPQEESYADTGAD
jgi:predicted nucleic acid-binding Zn ribbon protein